jgi:large subunit ribosomal protein L10
MEKASRPRPFPARLRAGFLFPIQMNKEQKSEVVAQIAAQLQGATAVYAVDYRGLSVTQAAELRTSLRQSGTSFRVVKNTLTLRAADEAGTASIKPFVEDGPTALAFVVDGDPALAAKALDTFARQSQVIELKGGVLEGEVLDVEQLRRLARLPSRDQLNAQLAGVVASPLTTLVRGLGSLLSGLAMALEQVRQQRPAEAPAAAAPAPEEEQEAPDPEASSDEAPADAAAEPEPTETPEETETETETQKEAE